MCGLAGAIGWLDPAIVAAVRRMTAAQAHRGPDGEGFGCSLAEGQVGHGVALGFRRLAIIDLSHDGDQPMCDERTGNVLAFNGEIYNFRELRRELQSQGVAFKSKTDTEVLLKAYGQWGIDAVRRLRGMFAFALWDSANRQLVLARDRLGIKPLYVYTLDRSADRTVILFASELRALLASGLVARRLDRSSLRSYLWNGFVVGPQTIIEGVRLLPAGTLARISQDATRCELERYWTLPHASRESDGVERLEHALSSAVEQHLISDVPLGVFLSGGVDSSAVAALAAASAGASVRTFTVGFDEAQFDESQVGGAVAEALGTQHTQLRLTQEMFRDQLADALEGIDQPTFDAINTYFVSRVVREAGMTVALAGTGGDELFGGYKSFVDIPRAARVSRLLAPVPEHLLRAGSNVITMLRHGRLGTTPPQTRWGKLGDALAARGRLIDLYQTSYSLFTRDFLRQLVQDARGEATPDADMNIRWGLPCDRWNELAELIHEDGGLHAISMLELSCYIGERLLRDTDAASMAVSLEVRVPLLDHEVVEAAAAVDPVQRFHPRGRKLLLRKLALEKLDPALFNRPKQGFVLPIAVWCRSQLKEQVASMLADSEQCERIGLNPDAVGRLWRAFEAGAPGIYWSRVWSLFVLLWWCKRHGVSAWDGSHG